MSALSQLTAVGVRVEALADGKLRATGNLTDAARALIRAHKPEILAELAAANDDAPTSDTRDRHWLIRRADGTLLEVIFGDALAFADVRALYPDAADFTPSGGPRRTATPSEAGELRALVATTLTDEAERAEALAVALADPDGALTCYRALMQQYGHA